MIHETAGSARAAAGVSMGARDRAETRRSRTELRDAGDVDTRREWDGLMLSADEGTLVGLADVVGREYATPTARPQRKGALTMLLIDADTNTRPAW